VLRRLDLLDPSRDAGVSRFRFCSGRAAVTLDGVASGSAEGMLL